MPNDTSLSTSLAPPLPTAYLRRATLRTFAPTFPHTAPPYYTYIFVSSASTQTPYITAPSLLYLYYIVSSASIYPPTSYLY